MLNRIALAVVLVLIPAAEAHAKKSRITEVTSKPERAVVTVVGFGECETPCRIEIDMPRQIVVAKAGYLPKRLTLQPGRKRVFVILELAAPTTGVDQGALPELD